MRGVSTGMETGATRGGVGHWRTRRRQRQCIAPEPSPKQNTESRQTCYCEHLFNIRGSVSLSVWWQPGGLSSALVAATRRTSSIAFPSTLPPVVVLLIAHVHGIEKRPPTPAIEVRPQCFPVGDKDALPTTILLGSAPSPRIKQCQLLDWWPSEAPRSAEEDL